MQLRPYQAEALSAIDSGWARYQSQLLVLATSLGKTVCFSKVAKTHLERHQSPVLIVAHREELLEQAQETLRKVLGPDVQIGWEKAERYARLDDQIVLASVATLGRMADGDFSNRLKRFSRDHFGLIIFDEAHHAVADTYQTFPKYFQSAGVLGVTATPKRGKGENLSSVFEHVAYRLDLVQASLQSLLTSPKIHRIKSTTNLSGLRTTAGDYNLADLAIRVNNRERNDQVVQVYLDQFRGRQAIVYATNLTHAEDLKTMFNEQNVSCEAITGEMNKEDRSKFIEQFRAGKIDILTNFGVLTEGFDYSALDLIISARPTQSSLLLTQILGRGMRLWENKPYFDFVEVVDLHSDLTATAASLFGFQSTFDPENETIVDCVRVALRLEKEKNFYNPWGQASYTKMLEAFETALSPEQMRLKREQELAEYRKQQESLSAERRKTYEGQQRLRELEQAEWEKQNTFTQRYKWTRIGEAYKLHHRDRSYGELTLVCEPNTLGGFEGLVEFDDSFEPPLLTVPAPSLEEAITALEAEVQKRYPQMDRLLDVNAAWKIQGQTIPCTDPQWNLISKKSMTELTREQVSKTLASEIIG